MDNSPDAAMDNFISHTAKTTVAVVVPLYGYWKDVQNNPLIEEHVLSLVMNRIYSNVHQLYIIFVANPDALDTDQTDPAGVANVLLSKAAAGNTKHLPVPRTAPYTQYVAKGVEYALNETKAQFVIVVNPWVMIQEGAIDVLVDRANRAGEAKAISGYDFREVIQPEQFDGFQDLTLKEQFDISFNFFCMPRFAAEMVNWNVPYQTHTFLEHDIAQSLRNFGFASINYPQAGIFPFDFPWTQYETEEQYSADQATFTKKWGFSLEVNAAPTR